MALLQMTLCWQSLLSRHQDTFHWHLTAHAAALGQVFSSACFEGLCLTRVFWGATQCVQTRIPLLVAVGGINWGYWSECWCIIAVLTSQDGFLFPWISIWRLPLQTSHKHVEKIKEEKTVARHAFVILGKRSLKLGVIRAAFWGQDTLFPWVFCMYIIGHFLEKLWILWSLSWGLLHKSMSCSTERMTKAFKPKFRLEAGFFFF